MPLVGTAIIGAKQAFVQQALYSTVFENSYVQTDPLPALNRLHGMGVIVVTMPQSSVSSAVLYSASDGCGGGHRMAETSYAYPLAAMAGEVLAPVAMALPAAWFRSGWPAV